MTNDTANNGDAANDTAIADKTASTAATDSQAATEPAKVEGQGDVEAKTPEQLEADAKAETDKKTDDKTAPVVPEKYEVPELEEGYTLEGPRLEFAEKVARDAGFTQEQFAQSAKAYVELQKQAKDFETAAWGKQSEAEFGKDFGSIVTDAKTAVKALEAERPGLLQTFDAQGWGNHPDALWLFAKVGKLLREGGMEGLNSRTSTSSDTVPLAHELYPNEVKK